MQPKEETYSYEKMCDNLYMNYGNDNVNKYDLVFTKTIEKPYAVVNISSPSDTYKYKETEKYIKYIISYLIELEIVGIKSLTSNDIKECIEKCNKENTKNMHNDILNLICGVYYYRKNEYSKAEKLLKYIIGFVNGYELYYLGVMKMQTLLDSDKTIAYEYFVKGIQVNNMHCILYLANYHLVVNKDIVSFFTNIEALLRMIVHNYGNEYENYHNKIVYNDMKKILRKVFNGNHDDLINEYKYEILNIFVSNNYIQKLIISRLY